MKAFKRVFLAVALLSSVPVLTLLAPSGHADQSQRWRVLVDDPTNANHFFVFRDVESRAAAAAEVEDLRDYGCTGVHAVPERAYFAQRDAGIVVDPPEPPPSVPPLPADSVCLPSSL